MPFNPVITARATSRELVASARVVAARSFPRVGADLLLFRVLRLRDVPGVGRRRAIHLKDGVRLAYRLNRGDIQSIREVWLDQAYRLPFELRPTSVIDLGANIGFTSLFFAKRYGCSHVIAVEPVPDNAALTKLNLAENGVQATVIEAAVGPAAGVAKFAMSRDSNLGHLSDRGVEVDVVAMDDLLDLIPEGVVDLVKIDIEGGEAPLLESAPPWLSRVRSIIIEFHPDRVDYPGLVGTLQTAGFRYIAAGSYWGRSMDCFVKEA